MTAFLRRRVPMACPRLGVGLLSLVAVLFCWTATGWALTPAPGTLIVNRATVQYGDAKGNPLPSMNAVVTVVLSGAPLLRLEKLADSDPVAAGATFRYTLRYRNTGNAPATGVQVVDTLPANVTFQSVSAGGIHNPDNRTVTWAIGNLASGGDGSVTVTVSVPASLAMGTPIVNSASLSCAEGVQDTVNLTTTVGSVPNLALTKSGAPETVTPNGIVTYTLSYSNIGNVEAHQVRIMDQIPAGTSYVAGSAIPAASLSGDILTWGLGDVAAGLHGTVSFQVRSSPLAVTGQKISNIATIISPEQTRTSNIVVTAVSTEPRLLLTKEGPDSVRAGATITYLLRVENTGAVPLAGVVLSDLVPVGTTFVSSDGGGIIESGGRRVNWSIGNLAVDQKQTVKLIVRTDPSVTQGQMIDNTATATSNETPPQTVRVTARIESRTPGEVRFLDANGQPAIGYMDGDTIFLQVTDLDQNIDPTTVETVTLVLTNLKTGDTENIMLTETGPNTGIFRGSIPSTLNMTGDNSGNLTVAPNSRIQATYTDPFDASPVSLASALIDPLGIIFDSVTGKPIAGGGVTLRNWNVVTNTCDKTSWPILPPGQVNPSAPTVADGKFAFPLVPAGDYCFEVKPPAGYTFPSTVPDTDLPTGFTIGNGSRGEKFTLKTGDPPLIRDIPLDPPAGRLTVIKTSSKVTAAIGDLLGYSLKISCAGAAPVFNITLTDVMPHGIQYLPGSALINGAPLSEPRLTAGRTFTWNLPVLAPGKSFEITYRAVVGPDATRGDGVNTATATGVSLGKAVVSNTVSVKVRITAGIFTEKGTILGKIFLDRDGNRIQKQSNTAEKDKPNEPGIAGVALYLEDGTRVITDRSGKFSLLGILPGTHVLRVDETTLPKGLELVPLSNRFLGDGASQFVVMQPGGLFQADFAVHGDWVPDKTKTPPISTGVNARKYELPGSPETVPGGSVEPVVAPTGQSAASKAEGLAVQVPNPTSETIGEGGTASQADTQKTMVGEQTGAIPVDKGAALADGHVPPRAERPATMDWEQEIKTMTPELAFLSPTNGSALVRERIRVVLKAPFGMEPSLSLNDTPVSSKQIGRRIDYEKGQVTIYEYIDIHLNAGETNVFQSEMKDPFGIVRGATKITVKVAGTPHRIVIRTDKAEVPADGASLMRVEVSLRDKQDQIIPYATYVTVSVSAGEIIEKDADPAAEEFQIALQDGVGFLTIRAPRETGEAVITAAVDDRRETAKVFFSPHLRGLFLVGMGEVTIGHGQGKGNYGFLKDNSWFDNGIYNGGRGAFFLKGKIYEDILLTAAYDSDKKKRDDLFRENDTTLDTEDKYPIYGDESKTGYEALSADRLYLKLEKNRSYLLYGDYKTDLNETRLAAYNRSFNGLKYELNTARFKLRTFGSYTDQTQVIDALLGKGISGYYYLTKIPVVEGSERVVVEVRDRYWPDRVLSRESKTRGSDYEIYYDMGAILFKGPIPSHDGDYNPVYIVASYESRSDGEKYYVYGGRGAFQAFDWLEIGVTGVTEEKAIGNYQLIGTDLTLKLPRNTVLKAEYAQTKGVFEESGLFNWYSDHGWSVKVESEPLEKLRLSGYYQVLGNYFLNLSATDVPRGTTKYGFKTNYQLRPNIQLYSQYFDEKDDLNNIRHRLASFGVQTKFKKTKIDAEISNESSTDNYVPLTTTRSPFDISQETPRELTAVKIAMEIELRPDLLLTLSHKQNISQESYHTSQAGLNYQLNSLTRLYLREEYQKYQERSEMRTLIGVESQLIKNTVAYNEYRLADGADGSRNQSVLGLRNKFYFGKAITGNVAAEYLKTVNGDQRTDEPDAFAGSLALEYLPRDDVKITSRFEHRRELIEKGRDSYLAEVGMAYKLNSDYSLLVRERYFSEDMGALGQHTTSRTMVGLAYRPLLTNRFNALTKLEYKNEVNSSASPAFREDSYIVSAEGVYQATPRLQLTGKYAGKLSRDADFSSYTDLIAGRFLYDLTDRWDVGAEYRILTSHAVNSRYQGGATEIGYRVIKNLWVSAGYSFDKFDADLTGDGYQGEGPYLKLRVKFDETTFKGFRKASPPAETFTKASIP